jgi:hypothetical protein
LAARVIRACSSFFPISPRFIGVFFTSFLFFADAVVSSLNSYYLLFLSYIVGEDKSSEEPPRNRDKGVERVEGSRGVQEGKLFAYLVLLATLSILNENNINNKNNIKNIKNKSNTIIKIIIIII